MGSSMWVELGEGCKDWVFGAGVQGKRWEQGRVSWGACVGSLCVCVRVGGSDAGEIRSVQGVPKEECVRKLGLRGYHLKSSSRFD